QVPVDDVPALTCELFNQGEAQVIGRSRDHPVVQPRTNETSQGAPTLGPPLVEAYENAKDEAGSVSVDGGRAVRQRQPVERDTALLQEHEDLLRPVLRSDGCGDLLEKQAADRPAIVFVRIRQGLDDADAACSILALNC